MKTNASNNRAKSSVKVSNCRVISSVKGSMSVEGLKPSNHAQTVGKQYLQGKISSGEAVARIKAKHSCSFGRTDAKK